MGRKFSDQTIARLGQVRELLYSMAPPEVIVHRLAREWKVRPQVVIDYIRMVRSEWANEVEMFGGSATADEREFRREHVRKALHRQALRALSRTKRRVIKETTESGRVVERIEREPHPDETTFSRAIDGLIRLDGLEAPKQVRHSGAVGMAVAVAEGGDVPRDTPGLIDFLTRAATGALEPAKALDAPLTDGEQAKAEETVVRAEGAGQRNQSMMRAAKRAAALATSITSPGEPTAATKSK